MINDKLPCSSKWASHNNLVWYERYVTNECSLCTKAGHYGDYTSTSTSTSASTTCTVCPVGKYQPMARKNICFNCPHGKWS